MFDAIRRIFHLIFGKPQPIEWWLLFADLAIVFLIIWLDVPEKFHQRRLRQRISSVASFINEGHRLKKSVPQSGAGVEATVPWVKAVHEWSNQIEAFLSRCSAHASTKFLDETSMKHVIYMNVAQDIVIWYGLLDRRLSNLQMIIQNAAVYFP